MFGSDPQPTNERAAAASGGERRPAPLWLSAGLFLLALLKKQSSRSWCVCVRVCACVCVCVHVCACVCVCVVFSDGGGMHTVTLLWLPSNTGTWVEGFPVLRKLCLYVCVWGGGGGVSVCMCVCVCISAVCLCVLMHSSTRVKVLEKSHLRHTRTYTHTHTHTHTHVLSLCSHTH